MGILKDLPSGPAAGCELAFCRSCRWVEDDVGGGWYDFNPGRWLELDAHE